jgi:Domain of unknown function DUF29
METNIKRDWEGLITDSYYWTIYEIKQALAEGDTADAQKGLETVLYHMALKDRNELKSYLVRLMKHIIKYIVQPWKITSSWIASINHSRDKIAENQEEHPNLNENFVESVWDECLRKAQKQAEDETGIDCSGIELTKEQVFETRYKCKPEDE